MFDELSSEDEKKKWLFKENIRLQELSRNLEDERKLIEIQMGMLQRQQSKNIRFNMQRSAILFKKRNTGPSILKILIKIPPLYERYYTKR